VKVNRNHISCSRSLYPFQLRACGSSGYEHQVVLAKKWQAWIPLVYATGMITAGGIGLSFWEAGGRKLLAAGDLALA
jgi:hypothetical protein